MSNGPLSLSRYYTCTFSSVKSLSALENRAEIFSVREDASVVCSASSDSLSLLMATVDCKKIAHAQ